MANGGEFEPIRALVAAPIKNQKLEIQIVFREKGSAISRSFLKIDIISTKCVVSNTRGTRNPVFRVKCPDVYSLRIINRCFTMIIFIVQQCEKNIAFFSCMRGHRA